jgi:hypothetical protein
MTRIASHFTFCSPDHILRRTVVEIDEQNIVTHLFSLVDENVEPSQTLFFDGILSAEIISIKQNALSFKLETLVSNYNYVDLSNVITCDVIKPSIKPLVLDFGTDSTDIINQLIPQLVTILNVFTIFDIIAACTFYPAIILGLKAELKENRNTELLIWENLDLINKSLTSGSSIRKII